MPDFPEEPVLGRHPAREPQDDYEQSAGFYASPTAVNVISNSVAEDRAAAPPRKVLLPALLYIACCVSTFVVYLDPSGDWRPALIYSSAVMFILTAHELGHFFQAIRYGVPASYPIFVPMPFNPLGTMGAVIVMRGRMGNRKALFDIGVSGPLAGLVPALVFAVIGIQWSHIIPRPTGMYPQLGEPLLFSWLTRWLLNFDPATQDVNLHPLAYAAWVGFLITSLNLFPVGQLDGGHILYAILRRKSYPVASLALAGAAIGMVWSGAYAFMLMIAFVYFMGPFHPPTHDDEAPLGIGRAMLGVATLLFAVVGFTPWPFYMG